MSNYSESDYQDLLYTVLNKGEIRDNERTGVGTKSLFMANMTFDLEEGFPLLTTKRVPFKSVLSELLWFIEGSSDERRLAEIHYGKDRSELTDKKTIWTANADAQGKQLGYTNTDLEKQLGPVYGVQWRSWKRTYEVDKGYGMTELQQRTVDQLANLIHGIKTNPQSRRHLLSAWNVGEIEDMALPPCHTFSQFYVSNDNKLHSSLYQRSADLFLGVPFNIASYALLTHMIAQVCGLGVGRFTHVIGDAHIYMNHIDAINEQLSREPKEYPTLWVDSSVKNIDDFTMDSFMVEGYDPHETIKAEMAV